MHEAHERPATRRGLRPPQSGRGLHAVHMKKPVTQCTLIYAILIGFHRISTISYCALQGMLLASLELP